MKTIPAGTYLFKATGVDFSAGMGANMQGNSSSQIQLVHNNVYESGTLTFGYAMGSNVYEANLGSTRYYNVYDYTGKWGLSYRPGTSMPTTTYPDDTTEIRTVLINSDLVVSDLVYDVFWSNTEHEAVKLTRPGIYFEKGIIHINNHDRNAEFINIYKRVATTGSSSDYQKIATIPVTSTYDVESVTVPNRSYEMVCTCSSSSPDYLESDFSDAVYFNRNANFTLTYSFSLDTANDYIGFLSVSGSTTIFDKIYEYTITNVTEHNYSKTFTIPVYDDNTDSPVCDVTSSLKQGYYSKDGTSEIYHYGVSSGDSYTVDFVRNSVQMVPPFVTKLFNGKVLAYQFVSTFAIDGISVLKNSDIPIEYDYTITFYTQDGARNEYKLTLDKYTMLKGVSKTVDNPFPEYPLGFDNNIEPISLPGAFYIITDFIFDGGIDIELYRNSSEQNRVDKSKYLERARILNGILRDECDMVNPIIVIEYHKVPDFNYIYIPAFKRYYFLTKFEFVRKNAYRLYLHVDVLMSYKDGVKNLECYIKRNEYKYNKYITVQIPIKENIEINTYKANLTEEATNCLIDVPTLLDEGVNSNDRTKYGDCTIAICTGRDFKGNNDFSSFYTYDTTNGSVFFGGDGSNLYFISSNVYKKLLGNIVDGESSIFIADIGQYIMNAIYFPINFYNLINFDSGDYPKYTKELYYNEIFVGKNIGTGVSGYSFPQCKNIKIIEESKINETYVPHIKFSNYGLYIDLCEFSFNDNNNDFRDFPPYTYINIYLPYLGYYNLPPELVNKTIKIRYYPNIFTGDAIVHILYKEGNEWKLSKEINGQLGVSLPTMGSNENVLKLNKISSGLNTLVNAGLDVATQNYAKLGADAVYGVTNQLQNLQQSASSKPLSGTLSSVMGKTPIFFKYRNYSEIPTNYAKTYGFPAYYTTKLSMLNGFTIVDNPHLEGNDFNLCLDDEKKELEKILTSGFLLDDKT